MSGESWKEGANKRRDARHTKVSDEPKGGAAKTKNTKKWCRGKKGVEHKLVCMKYKENSTISTKNGPKNFWDDWRVLACSVCGKNLKFYYPFGKKNIKPDWVDK